ncbi:MAG: fumarylacetoacetate hydrolase family protein [Sphingobium sp.]|nr:fumarylacetoacetate hydrolase family protein [Sphingobium sp.]MCP5400107.1 fumarylacetoacetate hydrolase family protein [Sphingomonas sp.]
MTHPFYRLAVIKTEDGNLTVVERNGKLVPLPLLLEGTNDNPCWHDLGPLVEDWATWQARLNEAVAAKSDLFDESAMDAAHATFALPFSHPGNLICIGANYHDHVAEMPVPMTPTYPYAFLKPVRNTLRATGESVEAPRHVKMMDWEAELAVVIGRACKHVPVEEALDQVAGYINFNDLSARDWIADRPGVGIDWVLHKGHDGFAPTGPYFVPAQFIPDPQDLPVMLTVNGEVKQQSTTGQMIYGVAEIIAHLSTIMTLSPGDLIGTGTAAGVGHGRKPPEYLKPGDEVRMEIGSLGMLVTPVV